MQPLPWGFGTAGWLYSRNSATYIRLSSSKSIATGLRSSGSAAASSTWKPGRTVKRLAALRSDLSQWDSQQLWRQAVAFGRLPPLLRRFVIGPASCPGKAGRREDCEEDYIDSRLKGVKHCERTALGANLPSGVDRRKIMKTSRPRRARMPSTSRACLPRRRRR